MKPRFDIASSMDQIVKSPSHQEMFSGAKMMEKLAFKKVSDNSVGEVEQEMIQVPQEEQMTLEAQSKEVCVKCYSHKPTMGKCACVCKGPSDCAKGCSCGCGGGGKTASINEDTLVKNAYAAVLKVSEYLEAAGLERTAGLSLMLANSIVVEAKKRKAKKSPSKSESKSKTEKKTDKKDDKKDDKSKKSEKDKAKSSKSEKSSKSTKK